jgi:hypothetical protein
MEIPHFFSLGKNHPQSAVPGLSAKTPGNAWDSEIDPGIL